jgi:hypothetical protein
VLGRKQDLIAMLLNGKPGTAMASFKQLSDVELAAVATYTRNAWGNKAEDDRRAAEPTSPRRASERRPGRPHRTAESRLAALAVRHQPQGHRHDVPVVQLHHVLVGGVLALTIRPSCSSPACRSSSRSSSTS